MCVDAIWSVNACAELLTPATVTVAEAVKFLDVEKLVAEMVAVHVPRELDWVYTVHVALMAVAPDTFSVTAETDTTARPAESARK